MATPQTGVVQVDMDELMKRFDEMLNKKFEDLEKKLFKEVDIKLEETREEVNEKMNEVTEENEKLKVKISALEEVQQNQNYDIQAVRDSVWETKRKVIINEQYSRRNSIRIFGATENKDDAYGSTFSIWLTAEATLLLNLPEPATPRI